MSIYKLESTYYFGKDALDGIITELNRNAFQKPLLLYGGGSIQKNGIYDSITKILNDFCGSNWVEFSGIEPNPRANTIDRAIEVVRRNNVDLILAVGGGSVIDASKVIGAVAQNPQYTKSWDYVLDPSQANNKCIPIISVITLAGTASENNAGSVVTNEYTLEKKGVFTPSGVPFAVIENPEFTFTVSKYQTACGIFDCFSHLLEQFFGQETFYWTKEIIFANLRTLLKFANRAIQDPNDYEARSNILWTTSMSLNGTTSFQSEGDWSVHIMEHAFSGLWDIAHGAGLALITPYYLFVRSQKEKWFADKIIELGVNVFNTNTVSETINYIVGFIKLIGLNTKWNQFKEITSFDMNDFNFLLSHALKFGSANLKTIYFDTIELIKNKTR